MSFQFPRSALRSGARFLGVAVPCLMLAFAGRSGSAATPDPQALPMTAQPVLAAQFDALALPSRAWSVVDILEAFDGARPDAREVALAPQRPQPPLPPRRPHRAARPALEAARPHALNYGVFASVAVPMGGLPMQAVFRERLPRDARAARASLAGWKAWRRIEAGAGRKIEPALLGFVNREVNLAVTYRSDSRAHGQPDHWATPDEIARTGTGDCEDFALAKMWALTALGVPEERMQLVVLKDRRRGLYHAVLAVHLDEGTYILDNVTDRLRRDVAIADYHPLYSFAAQAAFIHGFAVKGAANEKAENPLGKIYPGLGAR